MTNAISLGMYSRRQTLERRLKELAGKGHRPAVVPRYRSVKGSWFDVSAREPLPDAAFQRAFGKLDIRKETCAARHAPETPGIP